jgi:two-component system chemotaxis response regulator CheY
MQVKALVIDDSGVMRKMVMKSLKEARLADFDFLEAADGKAALDQLQANDVHIAFVDWNMPNMTGIEFVEEVRKREKARDEEPIPLVMVTSEKTMAKVETALDEAGADAFISKPFTVPELQYKLKQVVEDAQLVQVRRQRKQRLLAEAQAGAKPATGFLGRMFG